MLEGLAPAAEPADLLLPPRRCELLAPDEQFIDQDGGSKVDRPVAVGHAVPVELVIRPTAQG